MLGLIARTPARATFCFSPPERLKVSRPRRSAMRSVASAASARPKYLGTVQSQVFQSEGDFVEHLGAQDLALRILEHCSDLLRDCRKLPAGGRLAIDDDPAGDFAFVGARNQPVDGADQSRLPAAAGARDQKHLAGMGRKRDVSDRRRLAIAVAEREVFDREWDSRSSLRFPGRKR